MHRILLAAAALVPAATVVSAQQAGAASAQVEALSKGMSAKGLTTSPHAPVAGQPRFMQGTAAFAVNKPMAHAPRDGAGAPTRSPAAEAIAPAAKSLAAGTVAAKHAPGMAGNSLSAASPKMLAPKAGAAKHAPATKAKP